MEGYQSYVVHEDITINPGVTLTIPEGVKISMPEDGNIIVEGQLIINGTEQNPVEIFSHSSAQDNRWGAICFNNACLLYTSPSPRDAHESRMPSSA